MIKACEKASKILKRDFGEVENLQVSTKGPRDFVTNSDKKVEKTLIEELLKYKKKFSVISEETKLIENSDKDNFWIIDPIDGTTNFLHGIPHFAISIALRFRNEILSGIVFDPIKDEIFFAEKNNGAYFNNHRVRVSKKNKLDECLFATNSKGIKVSGLNSRITGSAALDLAYVGAGRFDGYFQNNLNLWDIAAGALIVEEAGGAISDIDYSKTENINVRASSNNIYSKMNEKISNF
tara:strand:- start:2156 stop:2866 length:711 start_codon:yes stop_codon:yes gene_type:complete